MTEKEYNSLLPGDCIVNKINLTRKTLVNRHATEPITQVNKDSIKDSYDNWEIVNQTVRPPEPQWNGL